MELGGEPGQGVGGGGPEWRRRQAQGEGPSQEPMSQSFFRLEKKWGERQMKQRNKMGKRKATWIIDWSKPPSNAWRDLVCPVSKVRGSLYSVFKLRGQN